jgi:hypothetical protein
MPFPRRCICCSRDSKVENIGYNFYKLIELFMRSELKGIQYEQKGLKFGPSQVINSHIMEKIIKKGSKGVVVNRLNFILWKYYRGIKMHLGKVL